MYFFLGGGHEKVVLHEITLIKKYRVLLFQEKDDCSTGSRRILLWLIGLLKTEGQSLIRVIMGKQNNKKTKKDVIACDQILSRD